MERYDTTVLSVYIVGESVVILRLQYSFSAEIWAERQTSTTTMAATTYKKGLTLEIAY